MPNARAHASMMIDIPIILPSLVRHSADDSHSAAQRQLVRFAFCVRICVVFIYVLS